MKKFLISIILFFSIITGCTSDKESNSTLLPQLYVDILIAQESYRHDSDSLKIITDSLYKHYQIPQDQYKREIEKFRFDEETWDEFFKLAEEYLDSLKAKEEKRIVVKKELEEEDDDE